MSTWYCIQQNGYTSASPTAPVASTPGFIPTSGSTVAGSMLQSGWIDVSGGVWSVNSAGNLVSANETGYPPVDSALLLTSQPMADQRIRVAFIAGTGYTQTYALLRHNGQTTGASCYAANCTGNTLNLSIFVNGAYSGTLPVSPPNGGNGSAFSPGTTYILDFSVTTTAGVATLSASILTAAGGAYSQTISYTDSGTTLGSFTSAALISSTTGVPGIGTYAGAGTAVVQAIGVFTDQALITTSYQFSGPSSAVVGVTAGPFYITPTNGVFAANQTISLSDGAGGTFSLSATGSPTVGSVTVSAGAALSVVFYYTPAAFGPHTITPTNSTVSGSPGTLLVTASLASQWYPQLSTVTFTGPVSANAVAGSTLQNGWIDNVGGQWSITSTGRLACSSTGGSIGVQVAPLLRSERYADYNGRIVVSGYYVDQIFAVARHNGSTSAAAAYLGGYNGGYLIIYKFSGGSFNPLGQYPSTGSLTSIPNTVLYSIDFSVVQSNSTTTTLTLSMYNPAVSIGGAVSSGSLIGTLVVTDTTTALQGNATNGAGALGIATYDPSANLAVIQYAQIYSDIPPAATAFNFTLAPTGGPQGVAQTFTVTPNGALPAAATVTISASPTGGSLSATTLSFTAGQTAGKSFTYTAAAVASVTITAIASNGFATITTTFAASAGPVTYNANNSSFQFSPGNWTCGSARTGQTYRQSWNNGAWVKCQWTAAATNPSAAILISSPSSTAVQPQTGTLQTATFAYLLNGSLQPGNAMPTSGQFLIPAGIIAGQTNTLQIFLQASWQANRWQSLNGVTSGYTPINYTTVAGIVLDGGSNPVASTVSNRPWGLIVGDSITEGIATDSSNIGGNFLLDYSYYLMQALDIAGYDTCISACGYNGWLKPGDYTSDVPAYYSVTGGTYQPGLSRWNYIDSNVSILDSNGQISAYGATGTPPSFIVLNLGTNEALYNTSTSLLATDFYTSIYGVLQKLRAAAPAAIVAVIMPFPFYNAAFFSGAAPMSTYATALRVAVSNYLTTNPGDGNTFLIDLGQSVSNTVYASNGLYSNGDVHPLGAGHAFLAPRVASAVCRALKIAVPTFRPSSFVRL
jgi:hypothetical protein